jgi:geranylgeranyl pyrophosphate synthase
MASPSLEHLVGLAGLSEFASSVDVRVDELLRGDASPIGPAATRVASAGGKRLRPALTFASAATGTPDHERVLNAAVAVELVQVGSLVHDDIFEAATVRRGIPTINAVEGDNYALMAGDYILARAGQAAALAGQEVARVLAVTVEELCIGQLVETTELFDLNRTIDAQLESIRRKTGVLYACACDVGALTGEVTPDVREALTSFGESFGIAFQLLDDVLDLVSDEARLGKPANIDIATGVYTMPVLLALQGPSGAELRERLEARDAAGAREIVLGAGTIRDVIARAREYGALASSALHSAAPSTPLSEFPTRYLDWALEHFPTDPALVA